MLFRSVFEITLTVDAKDRVVPVEEVVGADVVLVFDISPSMDWGNPTRLSRLQSAADSFIKGILEEESNRVSIVAYSGISGVVHDWSADAAALEHSYGYYTDGKGQEREITLTETLRDLYLDKGGQNGGTNCQAGFRAADEMLDDARPSAMKFVVYMSDGEANYYYRSLDCNKTWHDHSWREGCYQYAMTGGERKYEESDTTHSVKAEIGRAHV